jgi:adenylyltransferase/sulfurtransferase
MRGARSPDGAGVRLVRRRAGVSATKQMQPECPGPAYTPTMNAPRHDPAARPGRDRIQKDPPSDDLTRDELARYARQLVLPEIGENGQRRLRDGSVLLVGAGGLGSPLALYLAAAGVGRIGIVEPDLVEVSNLQRQVLYDTAQAGEPKHEAARARLLALNPGIRVVTFPVRLAKDNALAIIREFDVVADGADNFATRYLVNDACVVLGKPDVQGSVLRFEGQLSVFDARIGPCYRCLFPAPPVPGSVPSCADAGVLGALPGIIGTLQANEVLKRLLHIGEPLIGRLLLFDALRGEFQTLRFKKDQDCPACGPGKATLAGRLGEEIMGPGETKSWAEPASFLIPTRDAASGRQLSPSQDNPPGTPAFTHPGAPSLPLFPLDPDSLEVSPEQVQAHLNHGGPLVLLDVREAVEVRICQLPRMIWIPLGQLAARLSEVERDSVVVVYCHLGVWSLQAARFLRAHGVDRAWSLAGGIDAWARRCDSEMVRY